MLLILVHYRKCVGMDYIKEKGDCNASLPKEETYFSENPYCKALENARDIECEFPILLSF